MGLNFTDVRDPTFNKSTNAIYDHVDPSRCTDTCIPYSSPLGSNRIREGAFGSKIDVPKAWFCLIVMDTMTNYIRWPSASKRTEILPGCSIAGDNWYLKRAQLDKGGRNL